MWLALAFLSAFFAGLTAVIAKIGIKNINSEAATAVRTVIILIFSWIMVFITDTYIPINEINIRPLLFLSLSGLATGASWLCYFKALDLGDVNKVTPVDKSSTVLTMLLAFAVLGESLTPLKAVSMAAIGAGTYMMITKKGGEASHAGKKGWFFYAALSAVFASLTSILGKIGIQDIPSNLGTAMRTVIVLAMAWIVVFATGKQRALKQIDKKSLCFICLSGITTGLSWLCYYGALKSGPASAVVPIDKLSILVTVAFAYLFLGERLSKKAAAGLVLITAGTLSLLI